MEEQIALAMQTTAELLGLSGTSTTSYGRVKSIISTDSSLNKSADVAPCQAQKTMIFPELSPATTSTG